jgi:hypothetical protein
MEYGKTYFFEYGNTIEETNKEKIDEETVINDATVYVRDRIDQIINHQHQFLIFDAYYDYNDFSFGTYYNQKYMDAATSYGGWQLLTFSLNAAYSSFQHFDDCQTGEPISTIVAASIVAASIVGIIETVVSSEPGGPGDVMNSIWNDKKLRKLAKADAARKTVAATEYKYLLRNKHNKFKDRFIKDLGQLKTDIQRQAMVYGNNDAETAYYKQQILNYIDRVIYINRSQNYNEAVKNMNALINAAETEIDSKFDSNINR